MRPRGLAWLLLALPAVAALRALDVVEVRGRSMAPTLLPGDRLLVVRARPRVGDVAVVPDPREPRRELIKRVAAISPGGVAMSGDNAGASTSATVPGASLRWRAILRYWPPSRIGVVGPKPLAEGFGPAGVAIRQHH